MESTQETTFTGPQSVAIVRVMVTEVLNGLPRAEQARYAATLRRVYTPAQLEELLPGEAVRLEAIANRVWEVGA